MKASLSPHLNFRDSARQAMEFYQSVFGGELRMSTFKEFHASEDPSEDRKIMHAELLTDKGTTLMAADTPQRMEVRSGTNITLSLVGDDENELRKYFERLSSGGRVSMPLEKAAWGDTFGMCTDPYGINWMVDITARKP